MWDPAIQALVKRLIRLAAKRGVGSFRDEIFRHMKDPALDPNLHDEIQLRELHKKVGVNVQLLEPDIEVCFPEMPTYARVRNAPHPHPLRKGEMVEVLTLEEEMEELALWSVRRLVSPYQVLRYPKANMILLSRYLIPAFSADMKDDTEGIQISL